MDEHVHKNSAAFDLCEEVDALHGDSRKVLVASPDFQIVLRTLPAKARIADHRDHGRISVQTVRGHIRMHAGDREYDLLPGNIAIVDHGVTHGIEVLEDSAFLLTASMHAH
jgi:quercetin dioxygenase-like cupin family protein